MSTSKGGQRKLEKKSKKIMDVWRQGLSASVKRYYMERNQTEPDALPYKKLKRSKTCRVSKGEHEADHREVWIFGNNADIVCKCGKIMGIEHFCSKCEQWGKWQHVCVSVIKTNEDPAASASRGSVE